MLFFNLINQWILENKFINEVYKYESHKVIEVDKYIYAKYLHDLLSKTSREKKTFRYFFKKCEKQAIQYLYEITVPLFARKILTH